jgi:hypothetical protein
MTGLRQTTALLTLATCLAMAACGHGKSVKRYEYLKEAPSVQAVVILQPECYFRNMASYQVYQTWNDLAAEFTRQTGVVVIGPDEYRVLVKGLLTNLSQETDIEVVLRRYGIKPQNAIAVRMTLTESWQQGERAIVNEDGSRGLAAEFKSKFEYSADVYHVYTSRPLLSLAEEHNVRGLQLPTSADARPELTEFARSSYRGLVELLSTEMKLATGGPLADLEVLESPGPTIAYAFQDLQPLAVKLEQLDALERDARIQGLIEHRAPVLSRDLMRKALQAEAGLLVTRAGSCTKLQAGDLIVQVNGEAVTRPYQLFRGAIGATNSGNPLTLRVRRGSEELQAVYSCLEAAN